MNYWAPYVPVAVRRQRALREAAKLRKAGVDVRPVELEGRRIASTFWGKAWCSHLEGYSDYASRLPRGRTYVRNGSVFHLLLKTGGASARVSGSKTYKVEVRIKPLDGERWAAIVDQCAGEIGSLVGLLQGRLSENVMRIVTNRDDGMFPSPSEISFTCNCPDWAYMCKHVAAVLYGIGARLDEAPESLFTLRGVDPEALIQEAAGRAGPRPSQRSEGILGDRDLSSVFGVDIDAGPASPRGRDPATTATSAPGKASGTPARKEKAARPPAAGRSTRAKAKPKRTPKPAAGGTGAQAPGQRCYEDRQRGLAWAEISRRHGYRHDSGACGAARNYARRSELPWPVPLDPAS